MKLVYVKWVDHCSFTIQQWRTEEEYEELIPPVCETVGWVLKEDDEMMIVIQTRQIHEDLDDQFCGEMCIIKDNIKTIKELKL
jgi:hypothetical protein